MFRNAGTGCASCIDGGLWSLLWQNPHSEGLKRNILRATEQISTRLHLLPELLLCSHVKQTTDNIHGRRRRFC